MSLFFNNTHGCSESNSESLKLGYYKIILDIYSVISKVTKFSHFYDLSKKKHVALLFVVMCIDPSPLLTAALVMKL